jgi:hypothetical protein
VFAHSNRGPPSLRSYGVALCTGKRSVSKAEAAVRIRGFSFGGRWARCLRTATKGTGTEGVRMKLWRILGLTFCFTLLLPLRRSQRAMAGALQNVLKISKAGDGRAPLQGKLAQGALHMGCLRTATRQHSHANGNRAKEHRKWVSCSEKRCVSFAFHRLPPASTGLGGGLIFFTRDGSCGKGI